MAVNMSAYLTTPKGAHVSALAYAAAWPLRGLGRLRFHVSTKLVLGTVVVITVISLIGDAFVYPLYQASPLLLVLITPRREWLLLTADQIPLWQLLVFGTLRLCLTDPLYYILGRRGGEGLQGLSGRSWVKGLRKTLPAQFNRPLGGMTRAFGRLKDWFVRIMLSFGYIGVLLLPVSFVMLGAGATRLNPRLVALLAVIGSIGHLFVAVYLRETLETLF
jgi:hypothetical protein